ncbi:gluconate 2-dehydrogenase subunit 3 family protein [Massilia phyllosphaerae]|uniref:gluconate 2-dehydrogenase subunit 3 family protein n=1 Tax=Massilia phyllosphaerae TaxID=3106034 RepID=UPI002B1CCE11|nr:gluconate 2-dehydrogenase subunit 3 family protein [Massilia sp. SGZ-792]
MQQNRDRAGPGPAQPDRARRTALMRIGALCGLAGLGDLGLLADALAAAPAAGKQAGTPAFLSQAELQLTGVLADLVIPRTDTPGALDVGAHRTVDHLLAVCAEAPAQAAYKAGLARIDAAARANGGKAFTALPAARQVALLQALDTGSAPFGPADQGFFRQLKGYVAFAYYTSEAGASQELAYLPVPGGFKGDVKVTRSTHAWAI